MKLRTAVVTAAATAAVAAGLSAAPASAAPSAFECGTGQACFFETVWFDGKSVQYDDVPSTCTTLPFPPGALFNGSDEDVLLYTTSDCTGFAILEPANDFHSYPGRTLRSFRAA